MQEYYTAAFIKNKPESWAKSFYSRVCKKRNHIWGNELEFLSEIDKYRYDKYFLLPKVLKLLKFKEKDLQGKCPSITLAKAKEILKPFAINLSTKDCKLSTYTYSVTDNKFYPLIQMFNIQHCLRTYLFSINYKPIAKAIKSKLIEPSRIFGIVRTERMRFEILQLVENGIMKKEFMKAAEIILENMFSGAVEIASSLKREEKDEILKGLI